MSLICYCQLVPLTFGEVRPDFFPEWDIAVENDTTALHPNTL